MKHRFKSRRATLQHKTKQLDIKKYKEPKQQPKPKKTELKPSLNQKPSQNQIQAIEKRNNNSVQKHIDKLKKAGQKKENKIKAQKNLE